MSIKLSPEQCAEDATSIVVDLLASLFGHGLAPKDERDALCEASVILGMASQTIYKLLQDKEENTLH